MELAHVYAKVNIVSRRYTDNPTVAIKDRF